MIAVDKSALAAIPLDEPEADLFATALFTARRRVIGTPIILELKLVIARKKGLAFVETVDALLTQSQIDILAWDERHLAIAENALRVYGGGSAN